MKKIRLYSSETIQNQWCFWWLLQSVTWVWIWKFFWRNLWWHLNIIHFCRVGSWRIQTNRSRRNRTIQLIYNHHATNCLEPSWINRNYFGKYRNDQWYATANIFFVGERMDLLYTGTFPSAVSETQTLDAYTDINLNGGYHFNDFVSVFIQLNNILNNDYQRFTNFNVQGFQVLGGVTYKFDF